jgi:hypothetical protein
MEPFAKAWGCFVKFKDQIFELAETKGAGLFDPNENPDFLCRGCIANYEIRGKRLFLESLMVYADHDTAHSKEQRKILMPKINGREPAEDEFHDFLYNNIDLKINFSGTLLLRSDVSANFRRISLGDIQSNCEKMVRIRFTSGETVEVTDLSADPAARTLSMDGAENNVEGRT